MDRFRLKNIVILILVLVNAFLLGSLAQRRGAEQDAFRRTAEQLVALLEEGGMALDGGAISRAAPLGGAALVRDAAQEERAAAFLLGEALSSSDQGGGIFHYAGAAGEAAGVPLTRIAPIFRSAVSMRRTRRSIRGWAAPAATEKLMVAVFS